MHEAKMDDIKSENDEYLDIYTKQDLVKLYSDCYHSLGWTIINTGKKIDLVTITLQRSRKIRNRSLLCELQEKCEKAFYTIEKIENYRSTRIMSVSMSVGIVGTVFMAGAVSAFIASMIAVGIILSIPGFIGLLLPLIIYKRLRTEYSEEVEVMLNRNYDVIYEACEKAGQLFCK